MMDLVGRKGFKLDTSTLNTLLHTLFEQRKLKEALELLRSASKRGYLLDELEPEQAIYKFDELLGNGLVPDGPKQYDYQRALQGGPS
ncbi:hypothetical protein PTKIN_Ptkin16aG0475100 [Pterospermum kingtungense]